MKNLILTIVLFASTLIFAQNIEPKLEIVGQQVKATYYHENVTFSKKVFLQMENWTENGFRMMFLEKLQQLQIILMV